MRSTQLILQKGSGGPTVTQRTPCRWARSLFWRWHSQPRGRTVLAIHSEQHRHVCKWLCSVGAGESRHPLPPETIPERWAFVASCQSAYYFSVSTLDLVWVCVCPSRALSRVCGGCLLLPCACLPSSSSSDVTWSTCTCRGGSLYNGHGQTLLELLEYKESHFLSIWLSILHPVPFPPCNLLLRNMMNPYLERIIYFLNIFSYLMHELWDNF